MTLPLLSSYLRTTLYPARVGTPSLAGPPRVKQRLSWPGTQQQSGCLPGLPASATWHRLSSYTPVTRLLWEQKEEPGHQPGTAGSQVGKGCQLSPPPHTHTGHRSHCIPGNWHGQWSLGAPGSPSPQYPPASLLVHSSANQLHPDPSGRKSWFSHWMLPLRTPWGPQLCPHYGWCCGQSTHPSKFQHWSALAPGRPCTPQVALLSPSTDLALSWMGLASQCCPTPTR